MKDMWSEENKKEQNHKHQTKNLNCYFFQTKRVNYLLPFIWYICALNTSDEHFDEHGICDNCVMCMWFPLNWIGSMVTKFSTFPYGDVMTSISNQVTLFNCISIRNLWLDSSFSRYLFFVSISLFSILFNFLNLILIVISTMCLCTDHFDFRFFFSILIFILNPWNILYDSLNLSIKYS